MASRRFRLPGAHAVTVSSAARPTCRSARSSSCTVPRTRTVQPGARIRLELLDLEGDSLTSDQLREQTVRRGPQDDPLVQHRVADRQDLRPVGCGQAILPRQRDARSSPQRAGEISRDTTDGWSLLVVALMNSCSAATAATSSLEPGKALDQGGGLPASAKSPRPAGGVEGGHDRDEGVDEVVVDQRVGRTARLSHRTSSAPAATPPHTWPP